MPKTKATFIEPMLLLGTEKLPQGPHWSYKIKLDGYRALAIKSGGKVQLRSRNDNDFTERSRVAEQVFPSGHATRWHRSVLSEITCSRQLGLV